MMDDFKRTGMVMADDVGLFECQYTAQRPESRAKGKRIASRYARRKLKQKMIRCQDKKHSL